MYHQGQLYHVVKLMLVKSNYNNVSHGLPEFVAPMLPSTHIKGICVNKQERVRKRREGEKKNREGKGEERKKKKDKRR